MNRKVLLGSAVTLSLLAIGAVFFQNNEQRYEPRPVQDKYAVSPKERVDDIRRNVLTGEVDKDKLRQGLEEVKRLKSKRSALGMSFQFVGPNNIGGRTRSVLVDKDNNQRVYAGSTSGGLFISDNGGDEWTTFWDFEESLYISAIEQTENGDIYVGTGHTFDDGVGVGIYKSDDGGQTFSLLESTKAPDVGIHDFPIVNVMKADPSSGTTLYSGGSRGLYYTTDGGSTWTQTAKTTGCISFITSIWDMDWSGDGSRLFITTQSGVYYSDNPQDECDWTRVTDIPTSGQRIEVATTEANADYVYVAIASGGNTFGNVYRSRNKGEDWSPIDPAVPRSNPNWNDMGGQFYHNFLFTCSPADENVLFLGGVDLWRFDGNWTLAALRGGGGNLSVHVDHHYVEWDPSDPNIGYFANDGGVYKTLDGGYTFYEMARGFQTTQYYGLAFNEDGNIVGGTQDQGNHYIEPGAFGTPDYGNGVSNLGVLNGDGFDAAASQIVDVKITTAQFTSIGRSRFLDGQGAGIVSEDVGGQFWTYTNLWESANDIYSRDSIEFIADTAEQVIAVANGSQKTFTGFIEPAQPSAQPVYTSLYVNAGVSILDDFDGDGVLEGDGTGTVDPATGKIQVTFNVAPQTNAQVKLHYASNYPAGSVLNLVSNTENLPVAHVLRSSLAPGDKLKVQDPVQSMLVVSASTGPSGETVAGSGVLIARSALRFNEDVVWSYMQLADGQPNHVEFSPDGRFMYYASGSRIRRISGMENVYPPMTLAEIQAVTTESTVYTGVGPIGGFKLHPDDPNQMVAFVSGVGHSSHVILINNVATGTPASINISGDFPDVPVWAGEIDINDPNRVVVGTDYGVIATNNIAANPVEWHVEGASDFSFCEVRDVRQQRLRGSKNEGVMYFGTYGRGIWKSESLVSVEQRTQFDDWNVSKLDLLNVYPNPLHNDGKLKVITEGVNEAVLSIYNIKGDKVKAELVSGLFDGENEVEFSTARLEAGSYIITLEYGDVKKVGKFIKFD